MSTERFEFKIKSGSDGASTDLSALTLKESRALLVLLEAMTSIVELTSNNNLKIKIERGSAVVATESDNLGILYDELDEVINNNSFNPELVESYRKVQDLFYANGITYEATLRTKKGIIDVYNKFRSAKRFRTKSVKRDPTTKLVFLKGKLLEVGGMKPNFHILKSNQERLKISCSESDATRVNSFLYKDVFISAWKVTKPGYPVIYKFCDHYKDENRFEHFDKFINASIKSSHLDYLRRINEEAKMYLKSNELLVMRSFLKLFADESTDNSILKTLLIITKSFAEKENISDIRENIKSILEKKRGSKLI
ncbi:hypothetical protein QT327_25990 [Olivibacter sp. 47]|uniref:hypothetical protein n=1 Tax=Olivibacter sp. 47 TaxID=3056486 RepID=UPI0025A3ACDF|nr:hypothetical protein [Olivibacter sp. 47]MDM8177760.1 hypothetical protein [Olivibacter sp. 47]